MYRRYFFQISGYTIQLVIVFPITWPLGHQVFTMSVHLSYIWFPLNNLSSPQANHLKFMRKIMEHWKSSKFPSLPCFPFLSDHYLMKNTCLLQLEAEASVSYAHILQFWYLICFFLSRYKLCLIEERKKVDHLKLELKDRDDEIESIKKSLIEVQNEKEVKIRSLEVRIVLEASKPHRWCNG